MYMMFNGSPKDIIKQYHNIIGKPALPPAWSLGWHAAAYAYTNQSAVQNNIDQYASKKIPLEGIWLDIEYMDGYRDFTVNKTAFPTIKEFANALHQNNQKLIPIVDVGISAENAEDEIYSAAV
jgi:alpha-glucosidase (family GH31 glycosyl hydrolase)